MHQLFKTKYKNFNFKYLIYKVFPNAFDTHKFSKNRKWMS